jgi:hypothetical protein
MDNQVNALGYFMGYEKKGGARYLRALIDQSNIEVKCKVL